MTDTRKAAAPAKDDQKADNLSSATNPTESGALMEDTIKDRIDLNDPAVDDKPREGLPAESNQIDFNDPRTAAQIAADEAKA